MTAEIQAGAVTNNTIQWHSINWHKIGKNVRRLQARIVKARQKQKLGKVKALQRLLTHSFSAKALAVRRVTENLGSKTPGVDKEVWDSPEKKAKAISRLRQRGYKAQPLKRIYIPKANNQKRGLSIPTMIDRAQQALHLLALDPIAETQADPNSYGFRVERTTADAIDQCFRVLSKNKSPEWILEGDIRSCFDQISHQWLLANIPMDKVILKEWLKAGYIEKRVFHQTQEGTPQGGVASPVLARLVLNGLEKMLKGKYPTNSSKIKAKVNVVIYADDFIVTSSSKELLEQEIKPMISNFLKQRGLELSENKTKITNVKEGFDFLGQNIRKYKGKLLIKPSRKNIKSFLDKIRQAVKVNYQAKTQNLIGLLNPIIRGWANYHKGVASKGSFAIADHAIYKMLWRWAKRRHPIKSHKWIMDKYFKSVTADKWNFGVKFKRNGEEKQLVLYKAASTPIRRHTKIKAEANPYDPKWETYFEERVGLQMKDNLRQRLKLLRIWFAQNGKCPNCFEIITKATGWNIHHIHYRVNGGNNNRTNLVLLHPNCHRQLHSKDLSLPVR